MFHFFHTWIYIEATYKTEQDKLLGITLKNRLRTCTKCKKVEYSSIHCLGLNPPKYIEEWRKK